MYGILAVSWAMAVVQGMRHGHGRRWGRKKHLGFIPLTILWVVQKEKDRRTFEGTEEEFDRDRWYQTLGCSAMGNYFYSMEDFGNFIEILIDV